MGEPPPDGLLGYWRGVGPGGRLRDRSPEGNHGSYGPAAKWVWFTNPRAARHAGSHDRTYVGYLGGTTGRDIVVGTCDHDTGRFGETTLAADVSTDDHVGPAVFPRNDGHLLATWSEHDGPWIDYRVTRRPEDPDSFGETRRLKGTAVCYPNPVQPGDREGAPVYLFYRDRAGTGDGHVYYRRSTDRGESFETPTRLVTAPDGHYSVYWMAAGRDGTVHLFFTDAEGPSTGPKWSLSYAAFEDGTLRRADGSRIAAESALPVRVGDLEVLYDAAAPDTPPAWIWDSAVDADGNPAAVYATFPSALSHTYRYVRRVDGEWFDRKLVDAGRYVGADPVCGYFSGGITMPTRDPDVVYASVTREGRATIERYATVDAGRTFTSQRVTTRAVADNFRPVVPDCRHPDLPVVWIAGAYRDLDGSQTALRGVPGDLAAGGRLDGDGSRGASLGIDCYDGAVFSRGLTLAVTFETSSPPTRQTLVDFGGTVRLVVAEDGPGSVTCTLDGAESSSRTTCGGVAPDTRQVATATWDGTDLCLRLGNEEATAGFGGSLAFGGLRGWTIGKSGGFDGPGVDGEIPAVALYNRPLDAGERNRLRAALAADDDSEE